jgi:glycogen phosphorylase
MLLAERLVQGVDVWINTSRRPWEASGTSGMKVLVNGGINLSELDGWWAEAYAPEVGWALGDGREHGYDPVWDAIEADALYDLLEREDSGVLYPRRERHSLRMGHADAGKHRQRGHDRRPRPEGSVARCIRAPRGGWKNTASTAPCQRQCRSLEVHIGDSRMMAGAPCKRRYEL